jgi:hypothetical protein
MIYRPKIPALVATRLKTKWMATMTMTTAVIQGLVAVPEAIEEATQFLVAAPKVIQGVTPDREAALEVTQESIPDCEAASEVIPEASPDREAAPEAILAWAPMVLCLGPILDRAPVLVRKAREVAPYSDEGSGPYLDEGSGYPFG